jgi:uncharacterized protein YgiM (DUF1202 family)
MSDFIIKEAPEQIVYAYVVPEALNIRKGPSINDTVLGILPKDERVELVSNTGQWWKIRVAGIEGFVVSDYLRLEEEPAGDPRNDKDYLKYCFAL